jgi:DNA (cytosine-5)-methyltransferase 1
VSAKPRLLDLFSGAGGCARGYQLAGFHVTGVDNRPQPRYVGDAFILGDAVEYCAEHGHEYDAAHASPPCQDYSIMRHLPWLRGKRWPRLIAPTRLVLFETGRPYVIENLPQAPLIRSRSIVLCGEMFGLKVFRHRRFEYAPGMFLLCPRHQPHRRVIGHGRMLNDRAQPSADGYVSLPSKARGTPINGLRPGGRSGASDRMTVADHFGALDVAKAAMGIDWMKRDELAQAIPPAYCEFIGRQLLNYV